MTYAAIVSTRFYGPTTYRGSRIRATVHNVEPGMPGRTLWRPYGHADSSTDAHRLAAVAAVAAWRAARARPYLYAAEPSTYAASLDDRGYTFVFDRSDPDAR